MLSPASVPWSPLRLQRLVCRCPGGRGEAGGAHTAGPSGQGSRLCPQSPSPLAGTPPAPLTLRPRAGCLLPAPPGALRFLGRGARPSALLCPPPWACRSLPAARGPRMTALLGWVGSPCPGWWGAGFRHPGLCSSSRGGRGSRTRRTHCLAPRQALPPWSLLFPRSRGPSAGQRRRGPPTLLCVCPTVAPVLLGEGHVGAKVVCADPPLTPQRALQGAETEGPPQVLGFLAGGEGGRGEAQLPPGCCRVPAESALHPFCSPLPPPPVHGQPKQAPPCPCAPALPAPVSTVVTQGAPGVPSSLTGAGGSSARRGGGPSCSSCRVPRGGVRCELLRSLLLWGGTLRPGLGAMPVPSREDWGRLRGR